MDPIIQLIAAGAGTLGFALLFNVRGKSLIFGVIGGLLSWAIYLITEQFGLSDILACAVASIGVAAYAEICARRLRSPATVYIITGLIPLIPGSSLYHTMEFAVMSDLHSFLDQGIHTLLLAVAIAAGLLIFNTLMKLKPEKKCHRAG